MTGILDEDTKKKMELISNKIVGRLTELIDEGGGINALEYQAARTGAELADKEFRNAAAKRRTGINREFENIYRGIPGGSEEVKLGSLVRTSGDKITSKELGALRAGNAAGLEVLFKRTLGVNFTPDSPMAAVFHSVVKRGFGKEFVKKYEGIIGELRAPYNEAKAAALSAVKKGGNKDETLKIFNEKYAKDVLGPELAGKLEKHTIEDIASLKAITETTATREDLRLLRMEINKAKNSKNAQDADKVLLPDAVRRVEDAMFSGDTGEKYRAQLGAADDAYAKVVGETFSSDKARELTDPNMMRQKQTRNQPALGSRPESVDLERRTADDIFGNYTEERRADIEGKINALEETGHDPQAVANLRKAIEASGEGLYENRLSSVIKADILGSFDADTRAIEPARALEVYQKWMADPQVARMMTAPRGGKEGATLIPTPFSREIHQAMEYALVGGRIIRKPNGTIAVARGAKGEGLEGLDRTMKIFFGAGEHSTKEAQNIATSMSKFFNTIPDAKKREATMRYVQDYAAEWVQLQMVRRSEQQKNIGNVATWGDKVFDNMRRDPDYREAMVKMMGEERIAFIQTTHNYFSAADKVGGMARVTDVDVDKTSRAERFFNFVAKSAEKHLGMTMAQISSRVLGTVRHHTHRSTFFFDFFRRMNEGRASNRDIRAMLTGIALNPGMNPKQLAATTKAIKKGRISELDGSFLRPMFLTLRESFESDTADTDSQEENK